MIRRVAADAGINLALQGISVALGLVIGVALSRLLGAEGLSVYAFAMSLATLLGTARHQTGLNVRVPKKKRRT